MLRTPHLRAVLQALFVTFLWSTSWVLIKIGLQDIPALTFAGLRYSLAFLALLPLALRPKQRTILSAISRKDWFYLFLLGLVCYAATQGAQFIGLAYLPAMTVSLVLNFTSVLVAFFGIAFLNEQPTGLQWGGLGLSAAGIVLYFFPAANPGSQVFGLVVVAGGLIANALSSILGRFINRRGNIPPLLVTTISMGIGAAVLLGGGLLSQGIPHLTLTNWLIIVWMALVNTAFAFTLWNQTLRTLSAMESSIINGTMLVQIAVLAWVFLGESLGVREILGLALAGLGALVVQLRRREKVRQTEKVVL